MNEVLILDAACGTGGFIHYLQRNGFQHIKGFDLSPEAVKRSRQKTNLDIALLDLNEVLIHYPTQSFDVVVCHDALYFVQDVDFPNVLNSLCKLLKPSGQLIINLPAGNLFRGMHDRTVGIQKRWSYKRFEKMLKLSSVNYTSIEHWNWPFLLSPLILMIRLLQRLKLMIFPHAAVKSDVGLPSLVLNHIFYKLTKWERYLPFKRRFGSSLFIVIHL